jgi:hypothetical protein
MSDESNSLRRTKESVSILATCIVQTLNESDPTFQDRFLKKLTDAYYETSNNSEGDVIDSLEVLSWTRELLTGFSWVSGQGKPFLSK